jgi:hypothetical protein
VRVLYDEDLASHITPEPCAVSREGQGEASARGSRRLAIEPRKGLIPDADRATNLEGYTTHRAIASGGPVRRGQRPQHAWTLLAREPGDLVCDRGRSAPPVRAGKGSNP